MKKVFFIFFIFIPFFLIGSNPIEHVYLANKFFENQKLFSKDEKKSFILGTLFPDIRYLNEISREKTHFKNIEILDVLNSKTPFEAGKKFHSFVDEKRDEFIIKNNIFF